MKRHTPSGLVVGSCEYLEHRVRLSAAIKTLLDREWGFAVGAVKVKCQPYSRDLDPNDPWSHIGEITTEAMRAAMAAGIWEPKA